jgi:hypothetical protein
VRFLSLPFGQKIKSALVAGKGEESLADWVTV